MTPLVPIARALHFASLMTIFGAGAYATLLRRARLGDLSCPRFVRVVSIGSGALALASAIVWLALVAGQMRGDWHAALDAQTILAVLHSTRFGQIFLLRILGLAILLLMCSRRNAFASIGPPVLAAALLGGVALTSHAVASGKGDLSALGPAATDTLHLLAAGFWTGGLALLALLILAHRNDPARMILALQVFSRWGAFAVAVLVVTGFANVAFINPAAPGRSLYSDILAAKIAIALFMMIFACLNRWRMLPALASQAPGTIVALGRNVTIELTLGFLVIAIIGQLGVLPPR
jgi:putative copper export protein